MRVWNELGRMVSFVEVPRQRKEEMFYCFTIITTTIIAALF